MKNGDAYMDLDIDTDSDEEEHTLIDMEGNAITLRDIRKDDMLEILEENIAMVFTLKDKSSIENINARLEELQKELQLRKDGKSKMEKYISSLDTSIDYLTVYVDEYDAMNEVDDSDLMSEVRQRGLNVVEFINASKYDLRKFICQTLDINELYTDEEIFKMLKEIWKTQM